MIITLRKNSKPIKDIKKVIDLDDSNKFETEYNIGEFLVTIKIQKRLGIQARTIGKQSTDMDIL